MANDVGLSLNVAKRNFFDRRAVAKFIGKQNAKFLSKVGAFVRTRARSSLRRRKRISMPGETPSVHSRNAFASLKNILFAFEPGRQSVVIGPVKLNLVSAARGTGFSKGAVPGILEHGGQVGIRKIKGKDGVWRRQPFGHKRKQERLVPIWKATAAEKSASVGVVTIHKKGRALNFYKVPVQATEPSRIFWVNVGARPFMGPALAAESPNFPALYAKAGAAA